MNRTRHGNTVALGGMGSNMRQNVDPKNPYLTSSSHTARDDIVEGGLQIRIAKRITSILCVKDPNEDRVGKSSKSGFYKMTA